MRFEERVQQRAADPSVLQHMPKGILQQIFCQTAQGQNTRDIRRRRLQDDDVGRRRAVKFQNKRTRQKRDFGFRHVGRVQQQRVTAAAAAASDFSRRRRDHVGNVTDARESVNENGR